MQSDPVTLGSFRRQFIVKYIRDFSEKTKHFKSYYLQADLYLIKLLKIKFI
jgi:hypothetical protein